MKKVKLNSLEKRELENVKGGYLTTNPDCDGNWCGCGCYYASSGGSSTSGNYGANLGTGNGAFSDHRGDSIELAEC